MRNSLSSLIFQKYSLYSPTLQKTQQQNFMNHRRLALQMKKNRLCKSLTCKSPWRILTVLNGFHLREREREKKKFLSAVLYLEKSPVKFKFLKKVKKSKLLDIEISSVCGRS